MIWRLVIALFLLFMLGPILLVVLFSFGSNALIGFPMGGLTLDWYTKLAQDTGFHSAFWASFIVALATATLATITGTCAALALTKAAPKLVRSALAALSLPVLLPPLVVAIAIVVLFVRGLGLGLGLPVVILGHILVAQPFVILIVMARLARFDQATVDAARDLGATHWQAFRLVTLPQIASALIGAGSSAPPSRSMISSSPPSPSAAATRSRLSSGARCAPRSIPRSMRSRRSCWC